MARPFAGWILKPVRKPEDRKRFVVLPRRRAAERTFARLMSGRRLARDYERLVESGAAMVKVSMIHLMLKRLRPA